MTRRQVLGYVGTLAVLVPLAACSQEKPSPSAKLEHRIVGNPRPEGFTVTVQTEDASRVRLKVATDESLENDVVFSPASAPDADGWARMTVTGLKPNGRYFYDVEMTDRAGRWLAGQPGRARTLPVQGRPASFDFAFGSCMASGAKSRAVWNRILDRDPLLFLHLGDFGYFDNQSTSVDSHRSDFVDQIAANSGLADVLAEVPTYYIQSDHDAGGGNNAGPGPWTAPNRAAYRQVFPHPDLDGHPDGLFWSVVVGRVRLVFTDHKTYASPADDPDTEAKSLMGAPQKQWFKLQMQKSEPVKIWVQHSAFIDKTAEADKWGNYATEQDELAEFLRSQAVGEVVTVHGDMHAVAVSTDNPWGVRSWCGAPFDQTSSHKGGPWTSGPFPEADERGTRQYGYVTVHDTGGPIEVSFSGLDSKDRVRVGDDFTAGDLA
ncbi:MAG: alkaline phosphatase D family protein [Actinomycetes bacterium]